VKCLSPFFCVLILASCGQESINVAQTRSTDDASVQGSSVTSEASATPVQINTPANPEPANPEPANPEPANPEPANPEPANPEPANPEPANPEPANPEPANPEPANPEVASSGPKKVVPPDQKELSPAEVIARKLISHDSDDNLEVLNEALERWLTKKEALPERVGDLVNEQFLPMLPMAPEGKIFVIDAENRRVILIAEKK
jgi:outer membrane biosynthesis protein TonB